MQNSKLVHYLKTLSREEIREFSKFLKSPYHSSNSKLFEFFSILGKFYPEFTSKNISDQNIHSKLFPGKKFSASRIRNVAHQTIEQLESFLAFEDFRNDPIQFKRHLLSKLSKKDIESLFQKNFKAAIRLLESSGLKNEEYYLNKYLLESIKRIYFDDKTPIGKNLPIFNMLENEMDHILYFFFIIILKEYLMLYLGNRMLRFDYKLKFFEEIMSYLSKEIFNYKDSFMVNLYYSFLVLYRDGKNEKLLNKLKDFIDENKNRMTEDDYKFFYTELRNYYKLLQSEGDKSYGRKSFLLIGEMLKNRVPFDNKGQITAHIYTNIAAEAIRENELKWAEKFINDYKGFLPADQKENAYLYNYAVINYMKGSKSTGKTKAKYFGQALDNLAKVKSEDFYYMTRIKNMLIRIYFDLGDLELTLYLLNSYKKYLSKNKFIPDGLLERYSNFAYFAQKLVKIKIGSEEIPLKKLKKELLNAKRVEYKGWLLRKIDETDSPFIKAD